MDRHSYLESKSIGLLCGYLTEGAIVMPTQGGSVSEWIVMPTQGGSVSEWIVLEHNCE